MFLWICNVGQSTAQRILGISVSSKTMVDYYQFFRDICSFKLINTPALTQIGGPGHLVQVDESVITKRKYHRGKRVRERWTIGCYDILLKGVVVVHVPNRSADALLEVVTNHVLPGFTVWTDMWKGYDPHDHRGRVPQSVHQSGSFI